MAKLKIFKRGSVLEQKEKKRFLDEDWIVIYPNETEKARRIFSENGIEHDIRKNENGDLVYYFEGAYHNFIYSKFENEEEETVNIKSENQKDMAAEEGEKLNLDSKIMNTEHRVAARAQKVNATAKLGRTVNEKLYEPTQNELLVSVENNDGEKKTAEKSLAEQSPEELKQYFGILTIEEQERLDKQKAREADKINERRPKQKLGRDYQFKTRLTKEEAEIFLDRVKKSRLKQGEFMRQIMLNEEVNIYTVTELDEQAFVKIMEMASDLGRIGGLIKGTVIANKDNFSVFTADDKEKFEKEIRELNELKEEMQKAVQWVYGNSKTHLK